MKVLLISAYPPPAGGIATWTKQYMDWMRGNGHDVDLVDISVQGKRAENYTQKSLKEEFIRFMKIILNMCKFLLKEKYDTVHFNTSCSKNGIVRDKILSDILYLFDVKTIVQCHCNLSVALRNERSRRLFGKMINKKRKCLVLNQDSKQAVYRYYNKQADVIPNFLSEDYLAIISATRTHKDKVKNILYVGHLLRSKGCDTIVEVARRRTDLQFRLVGHISQDIKNINKTENVIFTGEKTKEDLWEEYDNADVFLFPTHTEGFPLAIAEAMAFGLPIVTTRVGAIPEMLEKHGAEYVEVGDAEAIVSALNIVEDKELRRKMSEFNQRKAQEKYMIDTVMNQLYSAY